MSCLICGDHGRPQKIWIAGMLVVRLLCDNCFTSLSSPNERSAR